MREKVKDKGRLEHILKLAMIYLPQKTSTHMMQLKTILLSFMVSSS